ncbi:MAG: hydantoinase/oxoprolinase family protein [Albidovulum sp.]|nr:hydantoinase/oxoprolinase family protein [Albidovulum sp.]
MTRIRVGVDIGGTFTDVALDHPGGLSTYKVLTDTDRPAAATLKGIRSVAESSGIKLSDIEQVIHGTTLVTNSLIERRGARTAFITTRGFRDVIEMRSENRFEQYDIGLKLPIPLVPRKHRFTARERIGPDGEVLLPLEKAEADRMAARVAGGGFESVAIGFLHSYANESHEIMMERALKKAAPRMSVSRSSAVSPQMRELPRFNTVVANAYVRPRIAEYLEELSQLFRNAGVKAPILIIHSGGGLISLRTAARNPVRLLESGPAGGAIFAAGLARAHGIGGAVSFDMGGTTAKICLVENGAPKTAATFEVARTYRFKRGSGMVISAPVVEMVEIGAGGGSVATVDSIGRMKVGPRSAGSEPGPACYMRGGTEPTVTDANLVLGKLDPNGFSGGAIPLDTKLSIEAIETRLGSTSGLTVQEAAFAVSEMVDENMSNAARAHAIENGRDLSIFTIIAFGGGAPLHACRLAEKLGISRIIVPPGAGVGSAIGFLRAPFSYEAARGQFQRMDDFNPGAVNAALESMESEARSFVEEGAGDTRTFTRLVAHMRYSGQGWEIPVRLGFRKFEDAHRSAIIEAFEKSYSELFGRTIENLPVEITNWSLTVSTDIPPVDRVRRRAKTMRIAAAGKRDIREAAGRRSVSASEFHRRDLAPGHLIDGPAIIVEDETSTIVTSAFAAEIQEDASILIERKDASK